MATYLADKIICFEGIPAKETKCSPPESFITGINKFLKMMQNQDKQLEKILQALDCEESKRLEKSL